MEKILAVLLVCAVVIKEHSTDENLGSFKNVCKRCHYTDGFGYLPYPNQCGKFIQCWKHLNAYHVKSCPIGLHWDATSETCNFPARAKCASGFGYCCPENWVRHGTSCYLFIGDKRTWTEASHTCEARGGVLAAVESGEERDFIRGYLKVFAGLGANMNTWIGGTDMEIEGTWRWSPSGKRMEFTDWFPGQPEKPDGGDCLIVWPGHAYHWGDISCNHHASFLCERPTTATG